jgi:hypothetical protein
MVNDYLINRFLKSLALYQLYLGTYGLLNILKVLNSLRVPNTLKYGAFGVFFYGSIKLWLLDGLLIIFKKNPCNLWVSFPHHWCKITLC